MWFSLQNVPLPSGNGRLSFGWEGSGPLDHTSGKFAGLERAVEQSSSELSNCSCSCSIMSMCHCWFWLPAWRSLPASGASLKLEAQPRACGEEGNEKLRSRLFFLSLINSDSFAPLAFRFSATPAISGRVNGGQGSGRSSGNSWGQC